MKKLLVAPLALALVIAVAAGTSSGSGEAHAAPPATVDAPAPAGEITVAAADPFKAAAKRGANHQKDFCDRVAACSCNNAASCSVQIKRVAEDLPDSFWTCFGRIPADDCDGVCDEWGGEHAKCFSAAEPYVEKRRNARAAEATRPSPALVKRAQTICNKDAACGCGDTGCDGLIGIAAALPESVWRCLGEIVDSCSCDEAGAQACFQAGQAEIAKNLARTLPKNICTKQDICGCGWDDCKQQLSKNANDDTLGLLQCWNGLDCKGICSSTQDPSTPAGMCLAQAQQRVQQNAATASEQQRRHHQTMMGIIGNMGAQRVDHYDANGVYQGTW